MSRYALYYAPSAGSTWARFGADWLARHGELTAAPRRYGFHATLKAPFRLADGARLDELTAELDVWCAQLTAFVLPPLQVALLGDFLALVPALPETRVDDIAAACTRRFDRYRAPLTESELARRRRARLTAREEEYLRRWGYPYVLDAFRFHLSLTGPIGAGPAAAALERSALERMPKEGPLFDAIRVFEEPEPGANFQLLHCARLRAAGRLVYVVGPSGSGKDSVIDWARGRLPPGSGVVFARRAITRPADACGEEHLALTDAEFDACLALGEFAMHWRANGQRYGISREIDQWLARGRTVVVNGSREYLPRAAGRYAQLEAVHVTAPRELLLARLEARGREAAAALASRLARHPGVPDAALEIVNDGPLPRAGQRLLDYLARGERAA
jgi:ribose 1,5-bisphosphokinase